MKMSNKLEDVAREKCARLLGSNACRNGGAPAEALVILAFTLGAAWALHEPEMQTLADAMYDAQLAGQKQ